MKGKFAADVFRNLRANEKSWEIGDRDIVVATQSGSTYNVSSAGDVTGGEHLPDGGVLNGSVYRGGGPIRTKTVMFGLMMEIIRPNQDYPKNYIVTSPVVSIKFA
ncbi:hypothetical protein LCGC14_1590710 [marine sediment metagenome]|uniref:Uncharacterized protein n=1 Tax=marine sediment metagenome TaxID=412755 RepID=A0A0F9IEE6_9ZZZZ